MTSAFEIPLTASPQSFALALGGTQYQITLKWNVAAQAWMLDFADASGNPLLCGVPLVTGADLLAQYPDMSFGGSLFALSDNDPTAPPGFDDLGDTAHLYWVTP